jgi:hypothetical protein
MPKINKHAAQLDKLRSLARPHLKVAAIGGGEDAPFEQQFSNIAHAYLKDKAPSLLDYEIGFQLIDRNQENTKAVGVFGFKVGSQWLYAPVFFLNGDLKGHELLYIKNQDLFVPMKENWLNYILNRKPNVLGSEVGRNLQDIGVSQPSLTQLSRSPSKYASTISKMPKWAQDAVPTLAYIATTNPGKDAKYKGLTSLPTFLQKEGAAVVKSLIMGFKDSPKLAQAFEQFHGLKVIDEAIGEIKKWEDYKKSNSILKESGCQTTPDGVRCFDKKKKKPVPPSSSVVATDPTVVNTEPGDLLKTSAVGDPLDESITYAGQEDLQVYVYDDVLRHGTEMENLNDKDREKLIKDKVLIKDKRPKAQTAYEVTTAVRLQNPGETGLYDVLVKSNKFEKCLVIFGPYTNKGRKDFVTVVRVGDGDDGRAWLNIHQAHIWTGKQYSHDDFKEWWDKLPDADSLTASSKGLQVLIGNTGEGTTPFSVDSDVGGEGQKIYDVYFKNWADKSRPGNLPTIASAGRPYDSYGIGYGSRIQLTGKRGASLRAVGEDLYVPEDYKILQLRPADKDDDDDEMSCLCHGGKSESDPPPILPGNQLDVDFMLGTKTASLKIYDLGNEVDINGQRMQKLAALLYLVRNVGLREKQARVLLERARMHKTARFRVLKTAEQSYDLQQSGPTAPGMPEMPIGYDQMTGGKYPTRQMGEFSQPIPEMSASNTDRSIYSPIDNGPTYGPDRQAQQAAMQAAQTGQKEVFDTAMIGSLLKAVRDDNMVDKYMGDLMKGLDRLGRILFLFYWHGEKFEDRYGKGDMVELEDGLRNAFEYLGDLVLFLKQRSVDPHDDGGNSGPDLSSISG